MELPGVETRIASRIVEHPETGCHLWTGATNRDGYGIVKYNGACQLVHRVVYAIVTGCPIPEGYDLDHLKADREIAPGPCHFRTCCNPDHIEAVPASVNRGYRMRRKHTEIPC